MSFARVADWIVTLIDRIAGRVEKKAAAKDAASAKVIVEEMESDRQELDKILSDKPAVPPPLPTVKPS